MLIDRFRFCERGYSSSIAAEKAIVCCFVDVSNNCGRREVVLSAGEVAVRDVMMGTRVFDVGMTPTGQKGRCFGIFARCGRWKLDWLTNLSGIRA